jgi:hypothetical protein
LQNSNSPFTCRERMLTALPDDTRFVDVAAK